MGKRIDLVGQQFGRLTVVRLSQHVHRNGNAMWVCQCSCGNVVEVDGYALRHGLTTSCGCARREASAARMRRLNSQGAQDGQPTNVKGLTVPRRNNQTGVVGVSYQPGSGRWLARMQLHGKVVLNATFPSFPAAVLARKQAEKQFLAGVVQTTHNPSEQIRAGLLKPPFGDAAAIVARIRLAYELMEEHQLSSDEFDLIKNELLKQLD